MKNIKAFVAAGLLAASLMGMTACSSATSTPEAPSAASSAPSSTASGESKAPETAAPKTIAFHTDVDAVQMVANGKGVSMDSIFPADKTNRRDAVIATLSFYDDMLNIQGFQQARAAGSDKQLIANYEQSSAYKVNEELTKDFNADIDANGYLRTSLPTAALDGSLGTLNGVLYHADASIPARVEVPTMPQAYAEVDAKDRTLFTVSGSYNFVQKTKEGPVATAKYDFAVSAIPGKYDENTKKQEWIVSVINIKNTGVSLTDPQTGAAL